MLLIKHDTISELPDGDQGYRGQEARDGGHDGEPGGQGGLQHPAGGGRHDGGSQRQETRRRGRGPGVAPALVLLPGEESGGDHIAHWCPGHAPRGGEEQLVHPAERQDDRQLLQEDLPHCLHPLRPLLLHQVLT